MSNKTKSPFEPMPGYLIVKPYIPNTTFKSEKEIAGEARASEVLAVGDSFIDDHGNKRTIDVKVGDVILHTYDQNDFEIGFDKYRAVHFSRILGIKK
jgi:co-chaperonin GroES (HSP10)